MARTDGYLAPDQDVGDGTTPCKNAMASRESFRKSKLCKFFRLGSCTRGEDCNFAHGMDELRALPNFMFTLLCKDFSKAGACKAGNDCKFAHGEKELRPRPLGARFCGFDARKGFSTDEQMSAMDMRNELEVLDHMWADQAVSPVRMPEVGLGARPAYNAPCSMAEEGQDCGVWGGLPQQAGSKENDDTNSRPITQQVYVRSDLLSVPPRLSKTAEGKSRKENNKAKKEQKKEAPLANYYHGGVSPSALGCEPNAGDNALLSYGAVQQVAVRHEERQVQQIGFVQAVAPQMPAKINHEKVAKAINKTVAKQPIVLPAKVDKSGKKSAPQVQVTVHNNGLKGSNTPKPMLPIVSVTSTGPPMGRSAAPYPSRLDQAYPDASPVGSVSAVVPRGEPMLVAPTGRSSFLGAFAEDEHPAFQLGASLEGTKDSGKLPFSLLQLNFGGGASPLASGGAAPDRSPTGLDNPAAWPEESRGFGKEPFRRQSTFDQMREDFCDSPFAPDIVRELAASNDPWNY
eukprot:TRINITY_DN90913_c0_g1_i1.p1 TRINITY_DN90913_c0_g1~~TRINITY_DN90913_c0_g1_i1.p1  ORF type:complete len:515 (-),score=86.74 TRINITY_DN90913_c0_g1_i1:218-1762(-)